MTAPTEAEIRAIVTTAIEHEPLDWTIPIRHELAEAIVECGGRLDRLYDIDDMRESERDALDRIVDEALVPIKKRVGRELEAAIIAAGLRFAAEYPDAPRMREPVPA